MMRIRIDAASCRPLGIFVLLGIWLMGHNPATAQGGKWSYVPCPQHPTATNTQMKGVTALSPSDAWAVGRWFDPNVKIHTLHWDGASWEFITPPPTAHLGGTPDLDGVDHAPNGDVWAVGYVYTGYPTDSMPLVMRRRNNAWDYVDKVKLGKQREYPYADRGGNAYAVECIGENDVWVAGIASGYGDGGPTTVAMMTHWDGSQWTEHELPVFGSRHNAIQSLSASGPNDIWAVGEYRSWTQDYHAFMVHWDGSQWSHVPTPIEGMSGDYLWDVAALAPNDVWAVGGVSTGGVLMHWDGTSWSLYDNPSKMGRGYSYLAAIAKDDIWTVDADNFFWHYNGVVWSKHSNPPVPGASFWWRSGGMAASGPNDVWSVGGWTDGSKDYNLTEHYGGKHAGSLKSAVPKKK